MDGYLNMVIEIPAGSVKKNQFEPSSKTIKPEIQDGVERRINYLPYLGNYGFIPSTELDKVYGGDGDAVDVLLIAESMPVGTVLNILPLGILKLRDCGEMDSKIIATPRESFYRVISAVTFEEMKAVYPSILESIELWFTNYKRGCATVSNGWGDEKMAIDFVINAIIE